jgi:hypothetical protein
MHRQLNPRRTAMRWKNLFRVSMLLAAASGVLGQQSGTIGGGAGLDRSFLMQALRAIEGHSLTVRVFQNPSVDPEKYVKVSVPVSDGKLQLPAIRKSNPSVSRLSSIFCQASDQTDETAARVLEGIVFLIPYSDQPWEPVQQNLPFMSRSANLYWTFVDAQGTPMAGASVEIRIINQSGGNNSLIRSDIAGIYSSGIYVSQGTLDDKGQLKRILAGAGELILTVRHPQYGIASMLYSGGSYDNGRTCIVPLVQKDSPAAAQSIQGTVVDNDGRPVKGSSIRIVRIYPVTGGPTVPISELLRQLYSATEGSATPINEPQRALPNSRNISPIIPQAFREFGFLTDEMGWFSFCAPSIAVDSSAIIIVPAGQQYQVEIVPPKSLNLHQIGGPQGSLDKPVAQAGSRPTYTLTPIKGAPSFHTFAFKYPDREISSPGELDKIELTLVRDGRQWIKLAYADFKDGFKLAPGTLQAEVVQEGGRSYEFPSIEIGPNSPKQLVFQTPAPITYRGKVIDQVTGEPRAGVYVTFDSWLKTSAASWTDQQWQAWQKRADQYAKDELLGRALSIFYSDQDRIYLTNADGFYEARLIPNSSGSMPSFCALTPGYVTVSTQTPVARKITPGEQAASQPDAKGIVELPAIKIERIYAPKILFTDEKGQVIDQQKLSSIRGIMTAGNSSGSVSWDSLMRSRGLSPAIYTFSAKWDDKYCLFESVDLRVAKPETIVFKLREVRPVRATFTGQVIDNSTGKPIWGALVANRSLTSNLIDGDASRFEPQQWEALKTLGSNPDPNNPALTAFRMERSNALCGPEPCAITDRDGHFSLTVNGGAGYGEITVLAKNFLSVQQLLSSDTITSKGIEQFNANKISAVMLPAVRMAPAATICFHMVLPDTGSSAAGTQRAGGSAPETQRTSRGGLRGGQDAAAGMRRVRIQWKVAPEDVGKLPPSTSPNLPGLSGGASMMGLTRIASPEYWPANSDQTAYVPAGIIFTLIMTPEIPVDSTLPFVLGPMQLERDQMKTLGRIELAPDLKIVIK